MAKYIDGDFCINIVDQSDLDEGVKRLIKSVIRNTKTANVVEVKHGEWTTNSDYPDRLICNKCRYKEDMWWADTGTKYCPNCGADMKGGAE